MPLRHAWAADNKVLRLTVSALGVLAVWSLNVLLHACALAVPVSLRPKKMIFLLSFTSILTENRG